MKGMTLCLAVLFAFSGCYDQDEIDDLNREIEESNKANTAEVLEDKIQANADYIGALDIEIKELVEAQQLLLQEIREMRNERNKPDQPVAENPDSSKSENITNIHPTPAEPKEGVEQAMRLPEIPEPDYQSELRELDKANRELDRLNQRKDLIISSQEILIADLEYKLAEAEERIVELEQNVASLEDLLLREYAKVERDSGQIAHLNRQIQDMYEEIDRHKAVIDSQNVELSRRYYVVGTRGQLEQWGVLKKNKLRKKLDVGGFNSEGFNIIDADQDIISIPYPKRLLKVITFHKNLKNTFEMVDNHHSTDFRIYDPETFWKHMHYLVIVVKS